MRFGDAFFVGALTLGSVACGGVEGFEDSDSEIGANREELGEASCASIAPDVANLLDAWRPVTSPRSYSRAGCYKAQVYDVLHNWVPAGGSGSLGVIVDWADTLPSDPVACESLWMASYLYKRDPVDGEFVKTDLRVSNGWWGEVRCFAPSLWWPLGFYDDDEYRITVSARVQPTTAAATRSHAIDFDSMCVSVDPDAC